MTNVTLVLYLCCYMGALPAWGEGGNGRITKEHLEGLNIPMRARYVVINMCYIVWTLVLSLHYCFASMGGAWTTAASHSTWRCATSPLEMRLCYFVRTRPASVICTCVLSTGVLGLLGAWPAENFSHLLCFTWHYCVICCCCSVAAAPAPHDQRVQNMGSSAQALCPLVC
jgi:hypothetical protein